MGNEKESKRSLAAIVFTDIADFGVLMGANEQQALRLSSRDHDLFKKICRNYEGKVLKSTGDGLLMYFNSAVLAVACSLKIQEAVSVIAKEVPADQRLCHRIGVHLGDVYVSPDDVMGDGVNIASRIQQEAEPGGICISQTVYDVVKNRLELHATPLGPRELKNIKEAVPIYRIVLDAADMSSSARISGSVSRRKMKLIIAAVSTLAIAIIAVVIVMFLSGNGDRNTSADGTSDAVEKNQKKPKSEKTKLKVEPEEKKHFPRITDAGMQEAITEGRRKYFPSGDFEGFARYLKGRGFGETVYCRMVAQLGEFRKAVFARLKNLTPDKPLQLQIDPNQQDSRVDIWTERNKLVVRGKGQTREFSVDSIPWKIQIAVMFKMSQTGPQKTLVSFLLRELKRGGLLEGKTKGPKGTFRPRFGGRGAR